VETAALPLGVLAGRLYLPIDARISPPLTTDELRQLCLFEVMLFHPVYGLTGFEEKSALRVWDLLERPSLDQDSWNAAQAGPAPAPRLVSIQIVMPETLEDLYGQSGEEIGVEPNADLPPSPDEPGAAGKIARSAGLFLSASLAGAMKFLPSGAKNSWLERMRNWAGAKAQKLSRDLENLRHKELQRLLHLLESNPDAGLRHAIPLNGSACLAVMRADGCLHVLGHVGGGFSNDDRRAFLTDLKDDIVKSDYVEVNDQVAYHMVRPESVIEISVLDLIAQTTRNQPINKMVLNWNSA
jgi:hypothetical protein